MIYLIGSLRNQNIPEVGKRLRANLQEEVFDDWFGAGPEADDHWKAHEQFRGNSYEQALKGHAAKNVFNFDKTHLLRADKVVLVAPAGKSGHLELGWSLGMGKKGYYFFPSEEDIRWDVMLQFCTEVITGEERLLETLQTS